MMGIITNQPTNEPAAMIAVYFSPMMYPIPVTAAPTFNLNTSFALSAKASPHGITLEVTTSLHQPNVAIIKSYIPPIRPLTTSKRACLPPFSPDTSTSVVAVASGNGSFPCMSDTKYFRNGIRKRMPRIPPKSDDRKIW